MLLGYSSYLFFIAKGSKGTQEKLQAQVDKKERSTSFITPIVIGLVGIVIAAELITSSSEYFVHVLHLNVVFAATLIGFAAACLNMGSL